MNHLSDNKAAAKNLMDHHLVISFGLSIFSTALLGISTGFGEWVLGDVPCQLFALISYFLVSSAAWLSSLAAFERYYKVASPDDHMSTFSEVNSKILIAGTYILSFVLCTGPLYGWGEYSHFKGKVQLTATLNVNQSHYPVIHHGFTGSSFFCKPITLTSQVPIMEVLKGICYSFMASDITNVDMRTPKASCSSGNVVFTLRSTDFSVIEDIYQRHVDGNLSSKISGALSFGFGQVLNTSTEFSVKTSMDLNEIWQYRDVYLPFQSLGICTLDFTQVNEFVVSSTTYVIITCIMVPYGVTLICAACMYIRYHTGAVNPCFSDITYLRIIYVCGSCGFILCLPYFIINYMNMHGVYVSREVNFMCTLLFYNSPTTISVPYFVYRFPSFKLKRRREHGSRAETIMLNGIIEETSSSKASLKYDSV